MRSRTCCLSLVFAAGGVSAAGRALSISFKIWKGFGMEMEVGNAVNLAIEGDLYRVQYAALSAVHMALPP